MSNVGAPKSPEQIQHDWDTNPRWKGIERTYSPADVVALQGSVVEEATLAAAAPRCSGASCTTWSSSTRSAR